MTSAGGTPSGPRPRERLDIRTTRGLALMLPVVPGDRVLVAGDGHAALLTSLRRTGAEPVLVAPTISGDTPDGVEASAWDVGQPFPVSAADHVIVAGDDASWLGQAMPYACRAVACGGRVLVARPCRRDARRRARALVDELAALGAEPLGRYGIRQSLRDVRHLVPLERRAVRWYGREGFLPTGPRGELVMRAATALHSAGLARHAFGAVAVVAQRVRPC